MNLLLTFLQHPRYQKSTKIDWTYFFKLLIILLFIEILYAPISIVLREIIHPNEEKLNVSPSFLFLAMVIIAPIAEEILFRLILMPTTKNFRILFLFSFCLTTLSAVKHNIYVFSVALAFTIIFLYICLSKKRTRKVQYFILSNFRNFFYLSCIIFGLVHLSNFVAITLGAILTSAFMFLPQAIAGGFLGYVRIKYGIIFSILFHSLCNLIPAVVKIFLS